MLSIRLRIITLAIVALTAVTTAFYIQYQDLEKRLSISENVEHILDDVRPLSQLVHSLQKERGLSAGKLVAHDEVLERLFIKQREVTNAQLVHLESANILQKNEFLDNLPVNLKAIRDSMDSGHIEWIELRGFYTSSIETLLEMMLLKIMSLNDLADISYSPESLLYIAISREKLGLIRATLNRVYQQKHASSHDLMFLNHQYNSLKYNLKTFEAITKTYSKQNDASAFLTEITNEEFDSVIVQIDKTLYSSEEDIVGSPSIWWEEATTVIDSMKKVEDTIFNQVELDSHEQVEYYKNYLYWYGLAAFIVLIAIILLSVLTVHRILEALYLLIHSLDDVQKTQNYHLHISSHPRDEFGKLSYSINNLLSYTESVLKDKEFLATTDLLTNIMNRRSFTAVAEKEIIRSDRYKTPLSMIYCDIDFFKAVNDNFSHAVGDEVLKKFAETIKTNLRSSDHFGRWGGEEFIVMAVETDLSNAIQLAEKLRQKIMSLSINLVGKITCSFGVVKRQEGESLEAICERVDQALYQAKNTGRNKVCSSE